MRYIAAIVYILAYLAAMTWLWRMGSGRHLTAKLDSDDQVFMRIQCTRCRQARGYVRLTADLNLIADYLCPECTRDDTQ
jgi:hypothetical protein